MHELKLIDSRPFGEIQCDFYSNGKDIFVTREQIGFALEYANPQKAIGNLHNAHKDRMDNFSFLESRNGRNIYFYNRKGVMELCRWSQQPKADAFMDFCWDTMDGLMSGETKLIVMPQDYPSALRALADAEEQRLALAVENERQRQAIEDFKPIAQYVDEILSSTGTMATTQIAADYDISARKLNRILHEEGIQRNVNGQWILYRRHMGMGYTKSITIPITHSDGRHDTRMHTHWTQKGRLLIHELLKKRGIMASVDRKLAGEQIAI